MRRFILVLGATVALAVSSVAPVVAQNDKNDVGVEFNTSIDLGNTFVNTNDIGDEVRFVVKLQKTRPNQDLYIEVWCGPTHDQSGSLAFESSDILVTNRVGNGNTGEFFVDMAAACGGSGDLTGHVDVGGFSSNPFVELTSQFTYTN